MSGTINNVGLESDAGGGIEEWTEKGEGKDETICGR